MPSSKVKKATSDFVQRMAAARKAASKLRTKPKAKAVKRPAAKVKKSAPRKPAKASKRK
jgi:hypothetical protein